MRECLEMAASKTASKITLDWSRLLGFDQAAPGVAESTSRIGAKVGTKKICAALGAKIGGKAGMKN